MLAYGAVVLFFAFARSSKFADEASRKENALASVLAANPGALSLHGMLVQQMAVLLTPKNYVSLLANFYTAIRQLTGIDKRGPVKNAVVFFVFYYLIVSAPAAVMRPSNFQVSYDSLSLFALVMMMLTNAIGNLISLKLTFRNVERLRGQFDEESDASPAQKSYWAEFRLYATTIVDAAMAFGVLVVVLILTSIFFGWSVGEYGITLSTGIMDGALGRAQSFWTTVNEPYQFAPELVPGVDFSAPMLLIFSLTTFVPTALLLGFSLFWTLLMPLRIIFHTELPPILKILSSEAVVFALCSAILTVVAIV